MASDVFGNEVGKMAIINAAEGTIIVDGKKDAYVLGVNITYNVPVQQVATFGKDVIFAKGTPSGSFTFTKMAGDSSFAATIKNKKCSFSALSIKLQSTNCKTGIAKFDNALRSATITMQGVVWNQFSIQGRAQEYFYSSNVGGFFHYISKMQ